MSGSQRGISLVEASIILSVVAVLAGITAPAVGSYLDTARQARAREDVRVIGAAIQDFIADNAENQFLIDGSNGTASQPPTRPDANRVNLLVSDGDIPALAAALAAEAFWTGAVNGGTVDTLSNHLIENAPAEAAGRALSQSIRHHRRHTRRQQHRLCPLIVERLQRAVCLARRLPARADRSRSLGKPLRGQRRVSRSVGDGRRCRHHRRLRRDRLPAPRCLRAVGRTRRGDRHALGAGRCGSRRRRRHSCGERECEVNCSPRLAPSQACR